MRGGLGNSNPKIVADPAISHMIARLCSPIFAGSGNPSYYYLDLIPKP